MFGRAFRYLSACVALAAGEACAALVPSGAEAWMALVLAASWVALLGYGFAVRGWPLICVFLAGAALYFRASVEEERGFRERPWLRNVACVRQSAPPSRLRRDLSERVGLGLGQRRETANLNRALLLGERRSIPKAARQVFVDSGTVHVFAISGLHVMAVAEVFTLCLAFLLVPVRFAGLVSAPLLWGYVAMIGFAPSAVRAGMMATIMGVAPVFWRRASGLRAWELTFLIVHIATPLMITNVGNALSFAVMLAIVLAGDYARSMSRWRQTLLVTIAAWATGVPISAHIFGRVTPGGMIGNLVLIATAKLTVVSGAFGILTSYVSETLAAHINNLSALGIKSMVLVAEGVSRLPGANFETGAWSILTCVEWYAALALIGFLLWMVTERRRALG